MDVNKEQWVELHKESRYRPKYPSENVVQFVFRNFKRDGMTRVLDLGCGAGRHIVFMANEKIVPYGVDYSSEGVDYTKGLLLNGGYSDYISNISVSSLVQLPYEDDFFDGIICYGVLYYMNYEEIRKAVNEIYRVLKQDGKGMIVVRNTEDYRCNLEKCIKTDEKNTYKIIEDDQCKCASSENGMLMHFFDKDELVVLFKNFRELKIDRIVETHDNENFCDSNFVVTFTK